MNRMNLGYWLDKAGITAILLGPAETAARLAIGGQYTGTEANEGMGILTAGLTSWNAAKYLKEREQGLTRSPLVHLGRALEVGGTASTEGILLSGAIDNPYRAFAPAAISIPAGAFLEYVAGPIHEMITGKFRNPKA